MKKSEFKKLIKEVISEVISEKNAINERIELIADESNCSVDADMISRIIAITPNVPPKKLAWDSDVTIIGKSEKNGFHVGILLLSNGNHALITSERRSNKWETGYVFETEEDKISFIRKHEYRSS